MPFFKFNTKSTYEQKYDLKQSEGEDGEFSSSPIQRRIIASPPYMGPNVKDKEDEGWILVDRPKKEKKCPKKHKESRIIYKIEDEEPLTAKDYSRDLYVNHRVGRRSHKDVERRKYLVRQARRKARGVQRAEDDVNVWSFSNVEENAFTPKRRSTIRTRLKTSPNFKEWMISNEWETLIVPSVIHGPSVPFKFLVHKKYLMKELLEFGPVEINFYSGAPDCVEGRPSEDSDDDLEFDFEPLQDLCGPNLQLCFEENAGTTGRAKSNTSKRKSGPGSKVDAPGYDPQEPRKVEHMHTHVHEHRNVKKVPEPQWETEEERLEREAKLKELEGRAFNAFFTVNEEEEAESGSSSDTDESVQGPQHADIPVVPEIKKNAIMESLRSLRDSISEVDPDWLGSLESISILAYQLYAANNIADVIVAFVAFMKGMTSGSVINRVLAALGWGDKDLVVAENSSPDGIDSTVGFIRNWKQFTSNEMFPKVAYLIGVATTMASCKEMNVDWTLPGFEMIYKPLKDEQVKAFDVIDAMLKTFAWCLETGAACVSEKSLTPLLYSDQSLRKFDVEVDQILVDAPAVIAGNSGSLPDFEKKVQNAIKLVSKMKKAKPNGPTAWWLQTKYASLVDTLEKIHARMKETSLKFAPFGLHISGATSVGKSTLTKLAYRVLLSSMDYEFDPSKVATHDNDDEYDTALYSDILVYILDDINQGKAEFAKKNMIERIIKFFNNVAARAVKAELNEKGVTFIQFVVGIITSNQADFGARFFSDTPEAALRRFYHTRVTVKPEYCIPGGMSLDTTHPKLQRKKLEQDVWSLDIEECFVYEGKTGSPEYRFRTYHMPPDYTDGPRICKNLSCPEWLRALAYLGKRHKEGQNTLLQETLEFDQMVMCRRCHLPTFHCNCPKLKEFEVEENAMEEEDRPDEHPIVTACRHHTFSTTFPATTGIGLLEPGTGNHATRDERVRCVLNGHVILKETRGNQLLCSSLQKLVPIPDHSESFYRILALLFKRWDSIDYREQIRSGMDFYELTWSVPQRGYVTATFPKMSWFGNHVDLLLMLSNVITGNPIPYTLPTCALPRLSWSEFLSLTYASLGSYHFDDNIPITYHFEENSLEEFATDVAKGVARRMWNEVTAPFRIWNDLFKCYPVRHLTSSSLIKEISADLTEQAMPYAVAIMPDCLYNTKYGKRIVDFWAKGRSMHQIRNSLWYLKYMLLGTLGVCTAKRHTAGFLGTLGIGVIGNALLWRSYVTRYHTVREEFSQRRDALSVGAKEIRSSIPKCTVIAGGILVAVKLLHSLYVARCTATENASADIEMNADTSPGWTGALMSGLSSFFSTNSTKRITHTELGKTIRKNMFYCRVVHEDGYTVQTSMTFLENGIGLLPHHVFFKRGRFQSEPRRISVEAERESGVNSRKYGRFALGINAYEIPEIDMVMVFMPDVEVKNRVDFLPLERPEGSTLATMVSVRPGAIKEENVTPMFQRTGTLYSTFYGANYKVSEDGVGKCMSPVISTTGKPAIVAFHIGCDAAQLVGVGECLTFKMYADARERFADLPGVFLSADGGEVPKKQMGLPVLVSSEIHPKSRFADIEPNAAIEVLGSTSLRTAQKSTVVKSPISDEVTRVTGVPNKWGPPQLQPNWKAYNTTLDHLINPSKPFDPYLLDKAVEDYLAPLLRLARSNTDKYCRVLTDEEAVRGIDGVRFIDAIKRSTSMGFPVFGKKHYWIDDDFVCDPILLTEVDRISNLWKQGKRAYPVFSACLKDEPLPIDKYKVRVFQACPAALSILVRKYFLGVCRFMSKHPLVSECAVGLNAAGPEWQKMSEFVETFSKDEFLAWDYKKFDVRMSCIMTTTVYKVMWRMAEALGYDKDDLLIMKAAIADITRAAIDWNGTLIIAPNGNVSGIPTTVYVNGIAGALYARMGFFSSCPELSAYRDHVHSMTYGDDYIGTRDDAAKKFNFRTYFEFLQEHDITITKPSKSSDVVDMLDREDADFLKRKSVYIPEIGMCVGALDPMSIYKSWHANLKAKGQPQIFVSAQCLEQGLHEFSLHGRKRYEQAVEEVKNICQGVGIDLPAVNVTFDERVEFWRSKYLESD